MVGAPKLNWRPEGAALASGALLAGGPKVNGELTGAGGFTSGATGAGAGSFTGVGVREKGSPGWLVAASLGCPKEKPEDGDAGATAAGADPETPNEKDGAAGGLGASALWAGVSLGAGVGAKDGTPPKSAGAAVGLVSSLVSAVGI